MYVVVLIVWFGSPKVVGCLCINIMAAKKGFLPFVWTPFFVYEDIATTTSLVLILMSVRVFGDQKCTVNSFSLVPKIMKFVIEHTKQLKKEM